MTVNPEATFSGGKDFQAGAYSPMTNAMYYGLQNLGAPVTGYPITYLAHGKQYVAVSVGNSLASSAINRLTEELHPGNASNVFVFVFAIPK